MTRLFLLLSIALLSHSAARAQDSTLIRLISQNQYVLHMSGGSFSGPGWDKLTAAIEKSQFVLVGESHGTAQVPQFAAAVAQVLKPTVYVGEFDPYVAQTLTQLAMQPGPPSAYLRQYPDALAFCDWSEEFDLIRALRAQQAQLVGLDQLFIANAAPFYAQLAGQVKNKSTRAYLQRRAAAYQAQSLAYERLGNNDYVLARQPAATVDSLLVLTKAESPTAQKMAQDYVASYRIYQGQIKGTGGHQERLNLMRRALLQALPPTQPNPKTLFKFGAAHLARGLSPVPFGDFYDVGNLAQDLAEAQDQASLHLYITGKQGRAAHASNPHFPDKNTHAYTAADNKPLRLFFDQVASIDWVTINLRPARRALASGKLHVDSPTLQRLLQGYDYLIVIPETTANHPM